MKEKLLYISTNQILGGSETLWSKSAIEISKRGYDIKIATYYEAKCELKDFDRFNLNLRFKRPSMFNRIVWKLKNKQSTRIDKLERFLKNFSPNLVIISQGNNVDGLNLMCLCKKLNIRYITITQLVTDVLWLFLSDEKIMNLVEAYSTSEVNYFVSEHNLKLHQKMLGVIQNNSIVIPNPFAKKSTQEIPYPTLLNDLYKIALVGRLETYHKGYDLLFEILAKDKWKNRNVIFNIYGDGPHVQLLKRLSKLNNLDNVCFKGHENEIANIWQANHILMMPSRMEGQSLSLIEAMFYKRAAIVTNVGGISELITHGIEGFIALTLDCEGIDYALEEAFTRRNEWKIMGERAFEKVMSLPNLNAIENLNNKIIAICND
ncbi:glycosyltransferase family 4 protein [Pedobacter aquae]|uniref:Glycosyltransferase family 4 protein n=1 Tax=Pedobacter aquae TaxID=2605747 RepID=A0A5C0VGD6_9SPHI|nr:glycosyltransferase family 4 protein [Pedobacter aquae]QEK50330.1 glycosyltransferase family 4 protein [Pedobacter aquae]